MKNLILMVGPPGSGKSTFSKEYTALGYTYVNQDSQGRVMHKHLFDSAIVAGEDIVVDRMGFTKEQRTRYLSLAKAAGYTTRVIVLHESYETCFARCIARQDHETIKDEHAAHSALDMFFTKYERVQDNEADEVVRIWPKGIKPLAVIIDLDGTIADIEHRRHFVQPPPNVLVGHNGEMIKVLGNFDVTPLDSQLPKFKKDWNGFFKSMSEDKPKGWCVDLVNTLSKKYSIVFCSGRPDNYRKVTADWLDQYVPYDNLFMRHRADQRRDSTTKEVILDFEVLTRYTPHFFIDDRDQVVAMWRKRGYTCLQCDNGNF